MKKKDNAGTILAIGSLAITMILIIGSVVGKFDPKFEFVGIIVLIFVWSSTIMLLLLENHKEVMDKLNHMKTESIT